MFYMYIKVIIMKSNKHMFYDDDDFTCHMYVHALYCICSNIKFILTLTKCYFTSIKIKFIKY